MRGSVSPSFRLLGSSSDLFHFARHISMGGRERSSLVFAVTVVGIVWDPHVLVQSFVVYVYDCAYFYDDTPITSLQC